MDLIAQIENEIARCEDGIKQHRDALAQTEDRMLKLRSAKSAIASIPSILAVAPVVPLVLGLGATPVENPTIQQAPKVRKKRTYHFSKKETNLMALDAIHALGGTAPVDRVSTYLNAHKDEKLDKGSKAKNARRCERLAKAGLLTQAEGNKDYFSMTEKGRVVAMERQRPE
jgi:hypothetical protein